MSSELIIAGAELAIKAIEYALANKQSESDLLQTLNSEEYDGLTEIQKIRIVMIVTDQAEASAKATIDALSAVTPKAPD